MESIKCIDTEQYMFLNDGQDQHGNKEQKYLFAAMIENYYSNFTTLLMTMEKNEEPAL